MTHIVTEGALHRVTIVPMIGALENLGKILRKSEAHAENGKIKPSVFLSARLYPDMFSLIQQLQYALFLPVDFAQHFTDTPTPKVGYEEATFADVYASQKVAVGFLKSVLPLRMDELANLAVPTFFDRSRGLAAETYAAHMVMPDFYFHLTVAYCILRHNGVPLGKPDFIGKLATVKLG